MRRGGALGGDGLGADAAERDGASRGAYGGDAAVDGTPAPPSSPT